MGATKTFFVLVIILASFLLITYTSADEINKNTDKKSNEKDKNDTLNVTIQEIVEEIITNNTELTTNDTINQTEDIIPKINTTNQTIVDVINQTNITNETQDIIPQINITNTTQNTTQEINNTLPEINITNETEEIIETNITQENNTIIEQEFEGIKRTLRIHYGEKLLALDEDNNLQFIHEDYLGSPRMYTDNNGQKTKELNYEPFGKQTETNDVSFTGHENSFSTNINAGLRHYDTKLSRWQVPDPLIHDTLSPYAYSFNNPFKYTDPDGRAGEFAIGKLQAYGQKIAYEAQKRLDAVGRFTSAIENKVVEVTNDLSNKFADSLNKVSYDTGTLGFMVSNGEFQGETRSTEISGGGDFEILGTGTGVKGKVGLDSEKGITGDMNPKLKLPGRGSISFDKTGTASYGIGLGIVSFSASQDSTSRKFEAVMANFATRLAFSTADSENFFMAIRLGAGLNPKIGLDAGSNAKAQAEVKTMTYTTFTWLVPNNYATTVNHPGNDQYIKE